MLNYCQMKYVRLAGYDTSGILKRKTSVVYVVRGEPHDNTQAY